jgi:hypothetical protein
VLQIADEPPRADAQNVTGDGTDAMNKECDYSAAYIDIRTSSELKGQGMTFSEPASRRHREDNVI